MKLELLDTNGKRKAPKTPAETLQQCPRCGCKELIKVDSDVLCGSCPWDSCQMSVDSGLMDNLFTRALRHSEQLEHGGEDQILDVTAPDDDFVQIA